MPKARILALVVAMVTFTLGGATCGHAFDGRDGRGDDVPTLHMDAKAVAGAPAAPSPCMSLAKLERVKGPVPAGAVRVVEMTVKGDRPSPYWMYEEAISQRAEKFCCDGVSVLRAVAEDGEALFHEVFAVGWRRAREK